MLKESMWGYAIIVFGILAVGIIWFFANTTRTDQHNFNLLKETTEAALIDSLDLAAYRLDGTIRIEEEKFVENLIRRFAENADLSNTYVIEIFDINTEPPKVSLRVSSKKDTTATGEIVEFDMVNNLDAILETKYYVEESEESEISDSQNQKKNCSTGSKTISARPSCTCDNTKRICNCNIKTNLNLPSNSVVKNVKLKTSSYYSEYVSFSNQRIENGIIKYTVESRLYAALDYYATRIMKYNVNYQYCY